MRRSFQPRLINGPWADPGLLVSFLFEGRALLFDLGDLSGLSSRDLLKITHVFVTHAHIDHFIGLDHLIRVFVGRDREIHLFGPPGFHAHVKGRLAGYAWNLVSEFEHDFRLRVTEVHPNSVFTATYSCKDQFRNGGKTQERPFSGVLLQEPSFRVKAVFLDHRIPCLGFSLEEEFYVSISREGLREMGLPVGPWLTRFKKALHDREEMGREFTVTWSEKGRILGEKRFPLKELAGKIARISEGQKIVYVTDLIGSRENTGKVIEFASGADRLFIEAAFLDCDREVAEIKYHLTARQAGTLAGKAGVKEFTVFHFSPRYRNREEEIRREALAAFDGVKMGESVDPFG